MRAMRLPLLLQLRQNGDLSDDQRIIIEDELFKHGYLNDVGD
jgi:hypothetical protein